MKRIFKYLLCLLLVFTIVGCNSNTEETPEETKQEEKETPKERASAKILCPTGAPSLAFVSEYEEINKNGKIDFVDGSDMLTAELTKSDSEYDIIVAPINLGTKLMETEQTDYRLRSVITWGNLYYVGTSEEALQGEGEIALFGQGAVPEKIVQQTSIETTLTPTYYNSATLVQQQLLSGNVQVGMLAEPLASATIAKAKQEGIELSIIKDLQSEYGEEGYPQAAIFVKGDATNHQELFEGIETFTNNGYEGLKGYLETIGIETLKLPSVDLVVSSIERQNVHYKEAKEVTQQITDFLALFNITYSDAMLDD